MENVNLWRIQSERNRKKSRGKRKHGGGGTRVHRQEGGTQGTMPGDCNGLAKIWDHSRGQPLRRSVRECVGSANRAWKIHSEYGQLVHRWGWGLGERL